jgi:polar amino acid transport system substrate-binding protein
MTRTRILLAVLLTIALAFALAACGDDDDSAAGSTAATTPAADCSLAALPLVSSGELTVGTDKPAFPPYFEDDDPTNGKGFESAVAYAIADELGFAPADVAWTVVPFNNSFAPGPKKFDFDINQISITAPRAKQVDFSAPYYTTPQAVVVGKGSQYAGATTFADLSDAQIGVQVGTTSLDAVEDVVKPSKQPRVYNDSNDTVQALKSGQVDAIVVDLPTAYFLTATEIDGGTIVGQFAAPGGDDWGVVLAKDSGLTPCVDAAIGRLRDSGELQKITDQWLGAGAAQAVPELT